MQNTMNDQGVQDIQRKKKDTQNLLAIAVALQMSSGFPELPGITSSAFCQTFLTQKHQKIPKTRRLSQLDAPSDPSVAPGFAASRPALGSQLPAQGRAVPVPQPGHPGSFTGHTGKAGGSALGTRPHHQQPPRTLGSLRPAQPFPNRAEKTPHSQIPLIEPPHKGEGTRLVHQQQDFHHRPHPAGHQDENLVF